MAYDPRQIRERKRLWPLVFLTALLGIGWVSWQEFQDPRLDLASTQVYGELVIAPALRRYRDHHDQWPASIRDALEYAGEDGPRRPVSGRWLYERRPGELVRLGYGRGWADGNTHATTVRRNEPAILRWDRNSD